MMERWELGYLLPPFLLLTNRVVGVKLYGRTRKRYDAGDSVPVLSVAARIVESSNLSVSTWGRSISNAVKALWAEVRG